MSGAEVYETYAPKQDCHMKIKIPPGWIVAGIVGPVALFALVITFASIVDHITMWLIGLTGVSVVHYNWVFFGVLAILLSIITAAGYLLWKWLTGRMSI